MSLLNLFNDGAYKRTRIHARDRDTRLELSWVAIDGDLDVSLLVRLLAGGVSEKNVVGFYLLCEERWVVNIRVWKDILPDVNCECVCRFDMLCIHSKMLCPFELVVELIDNLQDCKLVCFGGDGECHTRLTCWLVFGIVSELWHEKKTHQCTRLAE